MNVLLATSKYRMLVASATIILWQYNCDFYCGFLLLYKEKFTNNSHKHERLSGGYKNVPKQTVTHIQCYCAGLG